MKTKVAVIGSGFAGLVAAAEMARTGSEVILLEKNDSPGGRCRQFKVDGFTFDMGPSWYWMPEVFEQTFNNFGYKTSDFFELKRLDPSYSVFFKENRFDVPADPEVLKRKFEELEKGSGEKLQKFLDEASYKYKVGMEEFVWKPSHGLSEFMDLRIFSSLFKLDMLTSLSSVVRKQFKHPYIREILEFPVLFLGATPWKIPALYSLMNHADLSLGTWYPMGGMYEVIKALLKINEDLGVKILLNSAVTSVETDQKYIKKLNTTSGTYEVDFVINSADYHHFEQQVLNKEDRTYDKNYWDSRTMAPSSLLFYLGLNKKLENLPHHSLFFDEDFKQHAIEIYEKPDWPERPLFYLCAPSTTDPSVAPEEGDNLFLLMPLAPGLTDDPAMHEHYFQIMMDRAEERLGQKIRDKIVYKRSFCLDDFQKDYNAYKGNAYGLANTLMQTAFLKPKMKNKRIKNLLNCGQLTVPGPGMPPSLISGRLVAMEANKILSEHQMKPL